MYQQEQARRTIKIYAYKGHGKEDALRQLKNGIEEEAVPYELILSDEPGAKELAWQACNASHLEVGLGIDGQTIAMHYAKLDSGKPLFVISARAPYDQIRAIGANAARLVKKLPFKMLS